MRKKIRGRQKEGNRVRKGERERMTKQEYIDLEKMEKR